VSFLINPYAFGGQTLLEAIVAAGVSTANLKICLDAGDLASYSGGGQTWFDRSGTGTDFYLGTSSSPESADPVFNGSAGAASPAEYWSFDSASDSFTLVAGANPAWVEPFHKNGATYTIMCAVMRSNPLGVTRIFSDRGAGTGISVTVLGTSSGTPGILNLTVTNGGSTALSADSTTALANGAWSIVGLSVSENGGAAGGIFSVNDTNNTFNPNYTSPSSGSAAAVMSLPNGTNALDRFPWIAVWDVALSAADMTAIYNQTRIRFGI
jgi:hypothetical protein